MNTGQRGEIKQWTFFECELQKEFTISVIYF